MITILELINYSQLFIFGVLISICFCGVELNKENKKPISYFVFALLIVQFVSYIAFGLDITKKLYPFIVHIPLSIFLTHYFKCNLLFTIVSVLSAYLCCQTPDWFASLALYIFDNVIFYYLVNILTVIPVYYLLRKYVVYSVKHLINISRYSLLLFGIVPLMYYLFDYITAVYTNLLYSGFRLAVIFMPSLVSMFYFVFIIIYHREIEKRNTAENEALMMSLQMKQSKREMDTFLQLQEKTAVLRNDMRHHLTLLSTYINSGQNQKALQYIDTTQQHINDVTYVEYSDNPTINTVLSYFSIRAEIGGIDFISHVNIPKELSILDTDLCTIISNGLENAIEACMQITNNKDIEVIRINGKIQDKKLLLLIENNHCEDCEKISQDTINSKSGYGLKSIFTITKKYKGYCSYLSDNGLFTLKVVLPLK